MGWEREGDGNLLCFGEEILFSGCELSIVPRQRILISEGRGLTMTFNGCDEH